MTLFSGTLEFNNLFASYKGEGTGAVRHMFSHHILKPERMPIEANVWGTPRSSGSFSTLFRSRLLRALEYRQAPTEVMVNSGEKSRVCSPPFSGYVEPWPSSGTFTPRTIYLSCGDSAESGLSDKSLDLIVTDPPFFDNVHYSELADFFHAWRQADDEKVKTTRQEAEVQDTDANRFASKLRVVFRECHRILKDDGLLVFTYHHSRDEGWQSVAEAILGAGFVVVNSHPVKSEMSVATPKSQAKDPIQLDIVVVCRKDTGKVKPLTTRQAGRSARSKMDRLEKAGFELSRNDKKIVLHGQMLATLKPGDDPTETARLVEGELLSLELEDAPLFRWKQT
jgi:putative DNA methylase